MINMFINLKTRLVIVFLLFASITQAQKTRQQLNDIRTKILTDPKVMSVTIDEDRQSPSLIVMHQDMKGYSREQAGTALNNFLGVRSGLDLLVPDKQLKMINNAEVLEFQQYFRGIKVDRAKTRAFVQNGQVRFYNSTFYNVPEKLSTKPAINKAGAVVFAKRKINAKKYATEEILDRIAAYKEPKAKALLQKDLDEASPNPELVWVKNFNKGGPAEVKLAYKMNIYAAVPLSRAWVYVDANDGSILLVDAIIKHADQPVPPTSTLTSVQTRYAGNRNIYVKNISGNDPQNGQLLTSSHPSSETYVPGTATWVLIDDTRGNGIETYDLNGVGGLPVSVPPAYTAAKSFTDVDNLWTLAEHKRSPLEGGANEAENDDIAWDAHWGAEMVYDYWKINQNRLSFDGNNAKIKSFIHSGAAYDNAFWNGTVMTYGDGSGTAAMGFKPLTSLDVCGHEIGHGVCSNTSDLVYAKESGAMNEGLSDIWAACIEYFAIKTVDPSLAATYKPFYIGEQISADPASPLRRMDDPIAQGNPDTYGGRNWTSQTGCTPTLANDQCGVHNNSGVLNKWFYLLTVGSGAGSGPDAAFAGVDDGINDAVTTGPVELQHPANPYTVTGLGFGVAERIAFIMETMLTSTATFAEARAVSIAVATEMSGSPCSAIVESVTNAWYAVGVGGKFVKPCTITFGFITTNGAAVSETATPVGCTSTKIFNIPVVLPANSTARITVSGTATRNIDYIFAATTLANTTAAVSKQNVPVTIINDASIEGDEFVTLTIAISRTGTNPVNTTFKLTIMDDDVVPIVGNAQKTLLSANFTRANGFNDPTGWSEILELPETPNGDPVATGKNQWGIFENKLAITGKDGTTGTQFPSGTYNSASESQALIKTPILDGRGLSVLTIKFDYNVQGEVDPQGTDPENFPAFDYMALAYSLDGSNFIELNTGEFRQFASLQPTSGTVTAKLPVSLANKQFYLGFRWHNDANAGGPQSVTIDNLLVTGAPRKIENQLTHNSMEIVDIGQDVYFNSIQDGEILGRVRNNSTSPFGCTKFSIEKTGNSTFNLYSDASGSLRVSDKIVRVERNLVYSAPAILTLFYSETQLKALELATGKSRTTFGFHMVNATGFANAIRQNTLSYSAQYTAIPGIGGLYNSVGDIRLKGSFTLGTPVTPTPPSPLFVSYAKEQNRANSDWQFSSAYPNPTKDMIAIVAEAPAALRVKIDIVNSSGQSVQSQTLSLNKGINKINLNVRKFTAGIYLVHVTDGEGKSLHNQKIIKD